VDTFGHQACLVADPIVSFHEPDGGALQIGPEALTQEFRHLGVELVKIAGIAKQHAEDGARLASGTALFDALHAALAATAAGTGAARKTKRSSQR